MNGHPSMFDLAIFRLVGLGMLAPDKYLESRP